MKIVNCNLAELAEMMGPDADVLDAVAMREFLDSIVADTDELDADGWAVCLSGAMLDVLRLDPVGMDVGILTVMRDDAMVCTLDRENYPPGIGKRLQPHYDALVTWAEVRGLFKTKITYLDSPECRALEAWILENDVRNQRAPLGDSIMAAWLTSADEGQGVVEIPARWSVTGAPVTFDVWGFAPCCTY